MISYQNSPKMWLLLLLSLLFHSLTVSSLKPPSVVSLVQLSNGSHTKNSTTTLVTPTAMVGELNLSRMIREGIEIVNANHQFHGSSLAYVWLQRPDSSLPSPTILSGFNDFLLQFFLGNRIIYLSYIDYGDGAGRHWDGPRLGPPEPHSLEMQWEEFQSLVSLEEADQLMALAGYGGRGIGTVFMSNQSGRGLGYDYYYLGPYEELYLDAATGELSKVVR